MPAMVAVKCTSAWILGGNSKAPSALSKIALYNMIPEPKNRTQLAVLTSSSASSLIASISPTRPDRHIDNISGEESV